MSMNIEAEIRDLKRRVSEIEGPFGFSTQQIKSVHKDLLAFQAKTEQGFDRVNGRLDKVDGRLDKVDCRLDQVERGLRGLRTDMPKIVGTALRDVLGNKPRKA
jgi:tetrahydromethanopterin S-methyltransferase subunit G